MCVRRPLLAGARAVARVRLGANPMSDEASRSNARNERGARGDAAGAGAGAGGGDNAAPRPARPTRADRSAAERGSGAAAERTEGKSPSKDVTPVLRGWDYESGTINVRKIYGLDGQPKLQMRLDLGLLQMEMNGRPDGVRPPPPHHPAGAAARGPPPGKKPPPAPRPPPSRARVAAGMLRKKPPPPPPPQRHRAGLSDRHLRLPVAAGGGGDVLPSLPEP